MACCIISTQSERFVRILSYTAPLVHYCCLTARLRNDMQSRQLSSRGTLQRVMGTLKGEREKGMLVVCYVIVTVLQRPAYNGSMAAQ